MAHDVFISYSSIDRAAADAICVTLEQRGIYCWIAPRNITPGADWSAAIIDAINESSLMVLVMSSHANASRQIHREVERAINKGVTVLPYRVQNVDPDQALEYYIGSLQYLDAYSGSQDRHLEMLGDTVSQLLNRGMSQPKFLGTQKFSRKAIAASVLLTLFLAFAATFGLIKGLPYVMNLLRSKGVVERPKPKENPYYSQGVREFEAGKYDEAIASFDKAIQQDPNLKDAYHYRGQAYYKLDRYPNAILDYNKVLQLDPQNAEAYHHRGQAYSISGNYDQAIVDFSKAIGLKPDYAEAYSDRAQVYKKQGNEAEALKDLNNALRYDPNQAEIFFQRGLTNQSLDKHRDAIADFSQTLKLNPKHAKAANARGLSQQEVKNLTQAVSDFTLAIQIEPNFAEPYCNRGAIYLSQGNLPRAKNDFDRCGKLDPGMKSWTEKKLKQLAEKESKNIFKKLKDKFKKIF
jgi:tetratricopeptide (TPR) repeat protein